MLHPVAVDGRATADTIVVTDIILYQSIRNNSIAAQTCIAIHVNSAVVISPAEIASYHRIVGAVAEINSVLFDGARACIVLDENIIAEACKDSPNFTTVANIVSDDNVIIRNGSYACARHAEHFEAFNGDVTCSFEVYSIICCRVRLSNHRSLLCSEYDSLRRCSACGLIEPGVGSR